ncbi:hypothetical protein CD039_01115 [Staphylococcus argensis]|uniref:Uncharacterized protein n=1 Tax=Staphylococcus argensis TaxID=1607738 RepID=A0A2K4FDF7_9STAP|nr:hypothetical protein CD039_01115 [Staphylococcus argensis]
MCCLGLEGGRKELTLNLEIQAVEKYKYLNVILIIVINYYIVNLNMLNLHVQSEIDFSSFICKRGHLRKERSLYG